MMPSSPFSPTSTGQSPPTLPTDWSGRSALQGFGFSYSALVNHLSSLLCEVYALPPLPSLSIRTFGPLSAPRPTTSRTVRIHTIGLHYLSRCLFDLPRRFLSCIRSIFPNHFQAHPVYATLCFVTFVLRRCVYEISFLAVGISRKLELVREVSVHLGCLLSRAHVVKVEDIESPELYLLLVQSGWNGLDSDSLYETCALISDGKPPDRRLDRVLKQLNRGPECFERYSPELNECRLRTRKDPESDFWDEYGHVSRLTTVALY